MAAYVFPKAALASPHYLATVEGLRVLQSGGNAADAAVATGITLAVTCPHLCGVGGDLLAMVYSEGELTGLNSSGRLPAAAQLPQDGRVAERGIGSATVPGAAAGWLELLRRFGTRDILDLSPAAIRYAREGVWRSPNLAGSTERSREFLQDDAESSRIFLAEGPLVNTELADVLEDLDNFYSGPVAQNAPAPFTPEDFAQHRAEWVTPMSGEFAGVEVYEMPPNSRGHLALRALEKMEPLDGLTDQDPEFHLRMIRALDAVTVVGDTIYLCVHDADGMAVSLNQSNYMGFGSGVTIPGTGVHLHNRGAYHTPETYRGGDRPIHTLSPAMALDDGRPRMIFGTMGGEAQIQIHLQLLARVLLLGQDPADAVSAPRWVKRRGELLVEEGLPDLGGEVIPKSGEAGHAHMILVTEQGLAAASDPRCDGLAAGY